MRSKVHLKPTKKIEKSRKPKDPNAEREASRYDNPIASREVILGLLEESGELFRLSALATKLGLAGEQELEALRRRVKAMCRDGQLHLDRRGRIGLSERLELQACRVIGHRDGYGFASPVEGGEDLYLSSREMHKVFDGDRTLVAVVGTDARGRREGKVVEVLERAVTTLPGRYMEESGIGFLMPYNTRITQHILIPPNKKQGAVPGQMVSVRITDYPTQVLGAKGTVEEILGDHLDPGLEIDIAIRAHQIPWQWPDAVLAEAAALGEEPEEADKQGRIDLRDRPFVTIDGEDARDFDDAVYCQPEGDGYRLWVAIADVSHYVAPGSALDEEAIERGNSVYFPERVVPMFPEVLSNGLCSLKPAVDRLAMVCEMRIDAAGQVRESCFYDAVIHSHARLTYTQVAAVLEKGHHEAVATERTADLAHLQALYLTLRGARERRGAIDFETVETRIVFNDDRKIEAIVPVQRNDAHKLIEECMLAANVATAEFLESSGLPILFRVHEGPSSERLANVREFLGELALELGGGQQPTPDDYQSLLAVVAGREDASIIQTMLLRSLSQAVYQPENKGHFGLHYPAYAHFTSPIRRYPDLLVHRAIRSLIRGGKFPQQTRRGGNAPKGRSAAKYPYDAATMAAFGERCSLTERRADDATREVEAWLKCEFLRDRVGDEFAGVITAVTAFGIFVELQDLYIEGLVHISALPGDYYHFDAPKQRLVGERTRRTFQLGGAVNVSVARVDLDERKIDLEMVGAADGSSPRNRRAANARPGDATKRPKRGSRKAGARTGSNASADPAKKGAGKKGAGKKGAGKQQPEKKGSGEKGPGKKSSGKTGPGKKAPGKKGSGKQGNGTGPQSGKRNPGKAKPRRGKS